MAELSRTVYLAEALSNDAVRLVIAFAQKFGNKLIRAQEKYGWNDHWLKLDWADECRMELLRHVGKGDPVDVALYCAFLDYHGWPTSFPLTDDQTSVARNVEWAELRDAMRLDGYRIPHSTHGMQNTFNWVKNMCARYVRSEQQPVSDKHALNILDREIAITAPGGDMEHAANNACLRFVRTLIKRAVHPELVRESPTDEESSGLAPCPFCGSTSIDARGWASENSAGPACDDCGASAGDVSEKLEGNIAAWNKRAQDPDAARREFEIKEFLSALKDPENVHVNMLRGVIAVPSWRSLVDLKGEVPNGEDAQLKRIAELQFELDELRKPAKVSDETPLECADPSAVEAMVEPDHLAAVTSRLARSGVFASPAPRMRHSCDLDMLSNCVACDADKAEAASPEVKSNRDPNAVATVCLVTEPYGHGHFVEAQLQITPGHHIPRGAKLYEFDVLGWAHPADPIFLGGYHSTNPILYGDPQPGFVPIYGLVVDQTK